MELFDILKLFFAEPMYLLITLSTPLGWIWLALLVTQLACLVAAIVKTSRKLLLVAYFFSVIPCLVALLNYFVSKQTSGFSDQVIMRISGMAAVVFSLSVVTTLTVHCCARKQFRKVPVTKPEWPNMEQM